MRIAVINMKSPIHASRSRPRNASDSTRIAPNRRTPTTPCPIESGLVLSMTLLNITLGLKTGLVITRSAFRTELSARLPAALTPAHLGDVHIQSGSWNSEIDGRR
jgi:hypothetical protein